MKKIVVNIGTTERHENLYADEIVVYGRLIVNGIIRAKKIYGNGIIEADRIDAKVIVISRLEADYIAARKVIADEIFCDTAIVSVGIIAKDYIDAEHVKTTRLTSTLSRVNSVEANEIIRLLPKRSFFTAVFCSWFQEHFFLWRHSRVVKRDALAERPNPASKDPMDLELERTVNNFREKYRKGGYRLVLEAVSPEKREMRVV